MTAVSLDQAYDVACRQLGDAQVKIALLTEALEQAEQERDEAGRLVLELTSAASVHDGHDVLRDEVPPDGAGLGGQR